MPKAKVKAKAKAKAAPMPVAPVAVAAPAPVGAYMTCRVFACARVEQKWFRLGIGDLAFSWEGRTLFISTAF